MGNQCIDIITYKYNLVKQVYVNNQVSYLGEGDLELCMKYVPEGTGKVAAEDQNR